jgi:hypothetical protein
MAVKEILKGTIAIISEREDKKPAKQQLAYDMLVQLRRQNGYCFPRTEEEEELAAYYSNLNGPNRRLIWVLGRPVHIPLVTREFPDPIEYPPLNIESLPPKRLEINWEPGQIRSAPARIIVR